MNSKSAIAILSTPLTLPCGLTLPNCLVEIASFKCPVQETLAEPPLLDSPVSKWHNIYKGRAHASYEFLITSQGQVDIRFLSTSGDLVCHEKVLEEPHFSKWKEWA